MKKLKRIMIGLMLVFVTLSVSQLDAKATILSSNAYLSSFTVQQVLSNGETKEVSYSPAFSRDVKSYNATLDPTCVKLVITAAAEDSQASVKEYWTDIDPGENKTWVTVTAADGTTKMSYYIYCSVPTEEETTTADDTTLPDETTTSYEAPNNETGDAEDETNSNYTEIVKIIDKARRYTLVDPTDTAKIPAGYEETTITVRKKTVRAWTKGNGSAFYLVFAVDSEGSLDLYSYDNEEGTIQKFNSVDFGGSEAVDATNLANLQKEYDELKTSLTQKNSSKLKWILLLIAIIIILILIIFNLILKIKDVTSIDNENDNNKKSKRTKNKESIKDSEEIKKTTQNDDTMELSSMFINDEMDFDQLKMNEMQALNEIEHLEDDAAGSDEDDFADLNIDLTDSILAELTKVSQDMVSEDDSDYEFFDLDD